MPSCALVDYTGEWDDSNARALLRATASAGRRVAGLAFGNELVTDKGIEARLSAAAYARDVVRFGSLVRTIWPLQSGHSPLLLAPDVQYMDDSWMSAFLHELWPPLPSAAPVGVTPASSSGKTAQEAISAAGDGDESERLAPPPVDALTHHMYPLGASAELGQRNLRSKLIDPRRLDQQIVERLHLAERLVLNRTRRQARLFVSETGGAYNSGQAGVTDAFGSSFWWLALLGELGRHSHDVACRQTLVGGRYALVDLRRRDLAPDFWSTLLWRRLVSPKVLRSARLSKAPAHEAAIAVRTDVGGAVSADGGAGESGGASVGSAADTAADAAGPGASSTARPPPPPSESRLRSYAFCARATASDVNVAGGIVVLLLNLSPESTQEVTLELGGLRAAMEDTSDPNGTQTSRLDFVLTAPSLASRIVSLNGRPLQLLADGSIPALEGEPHVGRTMRLPPLSIAYYAFPEAQNAQCFTQDQLTERKRAAKGGSEKGKRAKKLWAKLASAKKGRA